MSAETLQIRAKSGFSAFSLDVDEALPLKGITALFGPSGGGKSTLLRIIAGLHTQGTNRVCFGDDIWSDSAAGIFQPPHLRPVGVVFQDARLFSHLSVAGNLKFAAKRALPSSRSITFDEVTNALGLEPLLARKPTNLSGGERQRVALGRTLLTQPKLMLLDEPLSALDTRRKGELLTFIEKVLRQFAVPALYVSHTIDEVVQIADDAVIMSDGRILGRGPVPAIFQKADMHGYTGYFEAGAIIEASIQHHDRKFHLTCLNFEGSELWMPMMGSLKKGNKIRLRVRARDVSISLTRLKNLSTRNCIPAIVRKVMPEPKTAFAEIDLAIQNQIIRARVTRQAVSDLKLKTNDKVFALIKGISFDRRTLISTRNEA